MITLINNLILPYADFTDEFLITKIKANLLSYGSNTDFLNVWYQQSERTVTAYICKMEQSIIIVANTSANFDELKEFIHVIGFKNLQAEPFILKKLGFAFTEYQVVFKISEKGNPLPSMPNLKMVYDILYNEDNPHIKKTDFNGFYVDLCHRIRHGTATVILNKSAVCVASHITDNTAIISGVATIKKFRNNGLGSIALFELLKVLNGRKVFAASESSVVSFYIKNGFEKYSKTAIYNIED